MLTVTPTGLFSVAQSTPENGRGLSIEVYRIEAGFHPEYSMDRV